MNCCRVSQKCGLASSKLIKRFLSTEARARTRNIVGLTKEELRQEFGKLDIEPFRADQVWNWVYVKGVDSFLDMKNIGKEKKEMLSNNFHISFGNVNNHHISEDGTQKYLVNFNPDEVECVYIPETDRGTLCLSSQVGCTMSCTFCHTGTQKLVRNLTAGEIVSQLLTSRKLLNDFARGPATDKRRVSNLVFMGQGEPLYNYRNVSKAIKIMTDMDGLALSKRKVTVSTCGVVPLIERLGNDFPGIGLAISLHAVNDKLRSEIVPINQQWPISELMETCKKFPGAKYTNKITFEYVMLKGVNDSVNEAKELVRLIEGFPSFVNLIPFNPWPGAPYESSSPRTIQAFMDVIENSNISVCVRATRGQDILAACGQLKTQSQKVKKSFSLPQELEEHKPSCHVTT